MLLVHSDSVFKVEKGVTPNYNQGNSLLRLMGLMENTRRAAGQENYPVYSTQYLFPFRRLELYGPAGDDFEQLDPTRQDNKTDFQKQNVKNFLTTDTHLMRGLVSVGDWTGPFLRISYRGGPDSAISQAAGHKMSDKIKLWLKVGSASSSQLLVVPYHLESDRYELEIWGYPGADVLDHLDDRGKAAFERGELILRPDLVRGSLADFDRDGLNEKYMVQLSPDNSLHPVLPLHLELAWADFSERFWDSQNGANYHYEFNMIVRGWDNFLGVGISPNPHGGVGFLEYRNLASNYGRYADSAHLGRDMEAWNFDAFGQKEPGPRRENFFAVDYMDLHILKGNCGIGLHRHRDNQEVFFMVEGHGLMVTGDWLKMPERERCFEIRSLQPGHFAMING